MTHIKTPHKRIAKYSACAMLALSVLWPFETFARRTASQEETITESTTITATAKGTPASNRGRRRTSKKAQSVTEATREAAINASRSTATEEVVTEETPAAREPLPAKGSRPLKSYTANNGNSSSQKTTASRQNSKTSRQPATQGKKKIQVGKPDLDAIRVATLDPKNAYYFPKLMEKYLKSDTTMTQEEFRFLYLGYMFQEDYDPYRESVFAQKTDSLVEVSDLKSRADLDKLKEYTTLALKDNPFDLRQMSYLVHAEKGRKKDMSAKVWEYRLENLLGVIKSTGTGRDEENAWFVIYPMHEYDMLQLLGYQAVDAQFKDPGYDYLVVKPNGTKDRTPAKGFYFNVQVPQQQYMLKHPEGNQEDIDE